MPPNAKCRRRPGWALAKFLPELQRVSLLVGVVRNCKGLVGHIVLEARDKLMITARNTALSAGARFNLTIWKSESAGRKSMFSPMLGPQKATITWEHGEEAQDLVHSDASIRRAHSCLTSCSRFV